MRKQSHCNRTAHHEFHAYNNRDLNPRAHLSRNHGRSCNTSTPKDYRLPARSLSRFPARLITSRTWPAWTRACALVNLRTSIHAYPLVACGLPHVSERVKQSRHHWIIAGANALRISFVLVLCAYLYAPAIAQHIHAEMVQDSTKNAVHCTAGFIDVQGYGIPRSMQHEFYLMLHESAT